MRAHALASENMDLQVVGYMDRIRLWNEIETFFFFFILFILEIVKIRRSPHAHFNFTNLCINTDVLSPIHTHTTHTHTHTLHAIHTHTHTHTLPSEEVPDSLLTGTNVFAQQFRTLERQEHENEKSPDTNDKTHPTPFKQSKLTPYQKAVLKERKKKKRNLKKNDC